MNSKKYYFYVLSNTEKLCSMVPMYIATFQWTGLIKFLLYSFDDSQDAN